MNASDFTLEPLTTSSPIAANSRHQASSAVPRSKARQQQGTTPTSEQANVSAPFPKGGKNTEIDAAIAEFLTCVNRAVVDLRVQIQPTQRTFFTVEEFAFIVDRTPRTVRDWIKDDELQATRAAGSGSRGRYQIPWGQLEPTLLRLHHGYIPDWVRTQFVFRLQQLGRDGF